jgi:hypothetical protein
MTGKQVTKTAMAVPAAVKIPPVAIHPRMAPAAANLPLKRHSKVH